jgi:Inner membrane protein YgaP-like, transmembrane domain
MKTNESSADRATRVFAGLAAIIIAIVGLGLFDGEIAGVIVAAVGAVALITGAIGFCPAYMIVGMSTCPLHGSKSSS